MATITADLVKQLRDRTGAGMMECKAALTEAGRAPDPIMRSATYRALFGAVGAGFEIGHREKLCDVVSMDPAFLPQPHHFTVTRAAAARLLPRWAARDGTVSALDRAYTSYRAMTRRTREPWLDALGQLAATPLVLRPEHVSEVSALPPIHKDPFDRILIAQAIVEDQTLVTKDEEISRYASERFRVIT